jgi:hypothetical protein
MLLSGSVWPVICVSPGFALGLRWRQNPSADVTTQASDEVQLFICGFHLALDNELVTRWLELDEVSLRKRATGSRLQVALELDRAVHLCKLYGCDQFPGPVRSGVERSA